MKRWTWLEIKTKVQDDLDLKSEVFISPTELLGYANEAIDEAESLVHTLYQDYYLTNTTISLVASQQDYDVPTDIYADKIRRLLIADGSRNYEIKRIRNISKIPHIQDSDDLRYILINDSANSNVKIRMYPTPSSAKTATIWYIRNANELASDTDTCDLPEIATQFVIQFMKQRCYEKEGHPNVVKAMQDTERLRMKLEATLAERVDDDNNTIEPNLDFYWDFDYDHYEY